MSIERFSVWSRHVSVMLLLLVGWTTALSAADGLGSGRPADVGLSEQKLRAAVTAYRRAIDEDQVRSVILMVARKGKVVLHEAHGWRNVEKKQPMETDTLIRMASNTKAFVATAILKLVEQGRLKLDDPIGKHLPAFDNTKCREMTVRRLLSHTSGLRIKPLFLEPMRKKSAQYPLAPNLQLEVDRFADVGPAVKPGTSYSYSNPGFNTLAALVEVLSGQPLEVYLTRTVYRPLGMKQTSHRPPRDQPDRLAVVYGRVKQPKPGESNWKVRFDQSGKMRVPFVRGSGGIVSTSTDYARFCQMFLNGGLLGKTRVLATESVREATRPQTLEVYSTQEREKRTRFYGLGWTVYSSGVYGHSGSEGTMAWVDPRHELIVLVFTQSPGGRNPRTAFFNAVVAAVEE